ncbi:hypothetical protein B4077_2367 [Bacillus cereus]|uniref:Uncharacterized protein n=1 Tax=Bacillus cereus TaxID=1396 RepID=A0A0G8EQR2_BACCE|nr:hypothetical protein B4077_2367 [Bacillus cereus]
MQKIKISQGNIVKNSLKNPANVIIFSTKKATRTISFGFCMYYIKKLISLSSAT